MFPVWGWIVIGWLALAVLTAMVRHLARQPVGMSSSAGSAFVSRLQAELSARHPDVTLRGRSARGSSAVLIVAGQETPVPLRALFRRYQAFPDAFHGVVDQLIEEIRSEGLHVPADHDFADVTLALLPQIKASEWIRQQGAAFGNAALVSRPLSDDLSLCYVIDEPSSMIYVCRAHLQRWNKTEEDIFQLASINLQRHVGGALSRLDPESGPMILQSEDGYDAVKVLLLDPDLFDRRLIAIPDRDFLWIGPPDSDDFETVAAACQERNAHATHPVSPDLYRLNSGQLERVSPKTIEL